VTAVSGSAPAPAGAVAAAVARAQLEVAQLHLDGRSRTADPAAATAWYRTAARLGDPHALNMLGRACELGWGMPADPAAAAVYYEKAAAKGDAWALFNLADLTLEGRGVPADPAKAYGFYARAAANGHAKSLNMMGLLHEDGRGVARDDARALALFRAAAEGGDCWGAFNHARRLADDGDVEGAAAWIERALELGFPSFFAAIGRRLAEHPSARLQALGRRALRLTESEAG
jgi:TPR repeat protein